LCEVKTGPSVWISPDPVKEVAKNLRAFEEDAEAFTVLESRCARGFSDAALVKAAWPFAAIRKHYTRYEQFAMEATKRVRRERLHPRDVFVLLRTEKALWSAAFALDPLLPHALWPPDYEGRRAWQARQTFLRVASAQATRE
jgi:DNA-binding transcriptional regulator PaaX